MDFLPLCPIYFSSPRRTGKKKPNSSRSSPNSSGAQREFSSSTLVCLLRVPPLCSPTLMSQSALIADFTRSGPIAARDGRDLVKTSQEKAGRGGGRRKRRGEGGLEGVGSFCSEKTCQQDKILTNDIEKMWKSHPSSTLQNRAGEKQSE